MSTTSRCMGWRRRTTRSWWRSWLGSSKLGGHHPVLQKWRYVPRGTFCSGDIVRITIYIYCLYIKQWKGVTRRGEVARMRVFRGRAKASAGTDAGVAGILQADQEGSDVASGCRRSGMVQEAGTRLPDEN